MERNTGIEESSDKEEDQHQHNRPKRGTPKTPILTLGSNIYIYLTVSINPVSSMDVEMLV